MRRLITLSAHKSLAAVTSLVELQRGLFSAPFGLVQSQTLNQSMAHSHQCTAVWFKLYPSTLTRGRSPRVSASFTSVRIVCVSPGINAM